MQDMNEPAIAVAGCAKNGEPDYLLDNPPYVPHIAGRSLYFFTMCPSAKHLRNTHYNLHNLYAHYEIITTHKYAPLILLMHLH